MKDFSTAAMRHSPRRSAQKAKKRFLLQNATETARSIPFSELTTNPLYRRIADAMCPQDLKEKLNGMGFRCASEVATLKALHGLRRRIAANRTSDGKSPAASADKGTDELTQDFFLRVQREALRSYRLMHHVLPSRTR